MSALLQPRQWEPGPGLAGMLLDAAEFPTLLPGVARKRRQPVQQLGHTASSTRLGRLDIRGKQSGGQPDDGVLGGSGGVCPAMLGLAGGEPFAQLFVPPADLGLRRIGHGKWFARNVFGDRGHIDLPNSTLSDCGS